MGERWMAGKLLGMNEQEQQNLFYEIFDASLPRLGLGDDASTQRALFASLAAWSSTVHQDPDRPKSLDLGCGNGAPTIQLAQHTDGTIVPFGAFPARRRRVRRHNVLPGR